MTEKETRCYSVQLMLRKNLNIIHRELYGPGKENGASLLSQWPPPGQTKS
jgi:hypothetical protein